MEETSKKVRHTKGPWRFELQRLSDGVNDDGEYINPRTIPDYYSVIAGEGFWRPDDNHLGFCMTSYISEANARLLASAPSLLEALEELYSFTPDIDKLADTSTDFGKGLADAINKARAVIKLAKGNGES